MFKKNKKVAIIRNALDFSNDLERLNKGAQQEKNDLHKLGLDPYIIDLRDYFQNSYLAQDLEKFGGVWVVGGNSFILKRAFFQSKLDKFLQSKLEKESDFVYGGYSAGICILAPSLRGIYLVDDPNLFPDGYKKTIDWGGLNILEYCIAPHYRSDSSESVLIEKAINYFITNKILFKALRDGESITEGTH